MRSTNIGIAVIGVTALGALGASGGVSPVAVILMALGFGLTVIAVGIGLSIAARRHPTHEPDAPSVQPTKDHPTRPMPITPTPGAAVAQRELDELAAGPSASPNGAPGPWGPVTPGTFGAQQILGEPTGIEPADALAALRKAAALAGDVGSAHLWLHDPATNTVRLVAFSGDSPPESEPVKVGASVLGEPLESRTAVLRPLGGGDTADSTVDRWRYVVPLASGEVRGVAAVDLVAVQPRRAVLNQAAARYRGALTAALVLHVSRTETAAARALLEAAAQIVGLASSPEILEAALDHALTLSEGQSGSIMLLDGDVLRIRASRGLPDHVVTSAALKEGEGIAGFVLASGEALIVEDLEDRGPRGRRHGIRSAMAVPIADSEGLIGVLNVGSTSFHARFSATHLASLEALGRIVGIALRNAEAIADSQDLYLDTVKALALALETKDPYSRGSTERVLSLAVRLGEKLDLDESELQALKVASLLHDIGMAAAGDLSTVGSRPLTTVERAMLKMHPVIAADVLRQTRALRAAVPIVYHHHEHFDGSGYVAGISGDAIPRGARILSVADAFVSMTSPRPYRDAIGTAAALQLVQESSGTQFDPSVVDALSKVVAAPVTSP